MVWISFAWITQTQRACPGNIVPVHPCGLLGRQKRTSVAMSVSVMLVSEIIVTRIPIAL
jgi:hypothetical protein